MNGPAPEAEAYQRFDAEDDQQILAEIQGRNLEILDRLVYSYTDRRGQTVTGLSLTGVRETIREMNRRGLARIKVTAAPPIVTETEEHIDAIVYAEDELNGGGSWGAKRQSKASGKYPNPFALEQAMSKAQRNAMFALIPAAYVVEMINHYLSAGKAHALPAPGQPKQITPPAAQSATRPAPAEPAPSTSSPATATQRQIAMIHAVLGELGIDPDQAKTSLGIDHWPDLGKEQASALIDKLIARRDRALTAGARAGQAPARSV